MPAYHSNLTLTLVVFESYYKSIKTFAGQNLTLTLVVFELRPYIAPPTNPKYLTLTLVVFESGIFWKFMAVRII